MLHISSFYILILRHISPSQINLLWIYDLILSLYIFIYLFGFVSIIPINRSSSGSSRQESPSVPSFKENERKLHGEKTESSIDEQIQTAADDSLRSDSVPSLPDEKGNIPCTCMYICLGRLPEPFEIFVTELVSIIGTW